MARKRKISDMAMDAYSEKKVADAIIAHADRIGTTQRIESGELSLPSEMDAINWYNRQQAEKRSANADGNGE